ncbi:MAG: hypothetical protein NT105_04610 [Verrucomicrobia bacterium]|nr:hypothetical protein [Verrucomicrobiota bacterium]
MTPAEIHFAADGMLQSLATWLCALGYDCLAGRDLFGRLLLEQAVAEERVFLTRNTHLASDWPHALVDRAQVVYVGGETLPEQLREVVERFSLDWQRFLFTRCVVCNEPLHTPTNQRRCRICRRGWPRARRGFGDASDAGGFSGTAATCRTARRGCGGGWNNELPGRCPTPV